MCVVCGVLVVAWCLFVVRVVLCSLPYVVCCVVCCVWGFGFVFYGVCLLYVACCSMGVVCLLDVCVLFTVWRLLCVVL